MWAQVDQSRFEFLYPRPGSSNVTAETPILIRFTEIDPLQISNLDDFAAISGRESGVADWSARVASDGKTIMLDPLRSFVFGEEVTVRLDPKAGGADQDLSTTFTFRVTESASIESQASTSREDPNPNPAHPATIGKAARGDPVVINGVSVPADFPAMQVIESDNPSPGYFFLNNWGGQPYNMILDNTGAPVWYWRTSDRRRDFKRQPNGWLTMLVRHGYGGGAAGHIALDSTFSIVDTMRATAGYITDEHELTMLADGQYFLIGLRESRVDMSRFVTGGRSDAIVRETVIQGFTPEGDLVFLWRSWDHFDIRDVHIDNLRGGYIRFPHMNAISIDEDGHILVSSRNISEITKIHRQTGDIIWRLGGAHNQFTWMNDPFEGFSAQHDIRALGNGRYTVFDNGNLHRRPETRAVEYDLDPVNMTATLVWQYRHSPPRFTPWMGNAQRLPNGNTLINYADASLPKIVEVRPDGSKALEMDFVEPANTYRAFKFNWMGNAAKPYMSLQNRSSHITLLFNKFGDPDVVEYIVYGGTDPGPTEIIATTTQPFIHLTELPNETRYYFRVTAVHSDGTESAFSNERSAVVRFIEPGSNMVTNGDFDRGVLFWDFEVTGSADANVSTTADRWLRFEIVDGGSEWWNVQFRQPGMPLVRGRRYRFEFDAYADGARIFEAQVTRDGEPWTNYGRIGLTSLTTQPKHYAYDFTMEDPSDFEARIVLNAGGSPTDVYVDNVSLRELVPSTSTVADVPETKSVHLHANYPNPFSSLTSIGYALPEAGTVTVQVFDLLGRHVRTLVDGYRSGGPHLVTFDSRGLPAGTYSYRMSFSGKDSHLTAARTLTIARPP
jgi:hypothetical protein